jgi:hypothetical protein
MSKLSTEQLEQLAGMQHAVTEGETVTVEAEAETKEGIRLIAG